DIILVNGSEGSYINISNRLTGHIIADKAKQFTWDAENYISVDWIKKQLRIQRSSCYTCSEPLDIDWSVDNKLPHIKDKCYIVKTGVVTGRPSSPLRRPLSNRLPNVRARQSVQVHPVHLRESGGLV